MAMPVLPLPLTDTSAHDQRVVLRGMSWEQFEALLATRGEHSVPRISYLNGVIELMSPGRPHESMKSTLRMLIEAYCFARDIYFDPMASTTLKKSSVNRGAEPDESYAFSKGREVPDLVIEVVYTSGSINKLELYRGLGIGEVWFWIDDRLHGYLLQNNGYVSIEDSRALPGLSLATLTSYASLKEPFEAVQSFKRDLAAPK
jgi:Uma2 family endonuclease